MTRAGGAKSVPLQSHNTSALTDWNIAPRPQLIVLDLDQTLWPFDAAKSRFDAPHRLDEKSFFRVHCQGATAAAFSEAVATIRELSIEATETDVRPRIAVASSNSRSDICCSLLSTLGLLKNQPVANIVNGEELSKGIRRGSKIEHLTQIAAKSGVDFKDMLLFDDSAKNIRVAQRSGVIAHQVKPLEGLTRVAFRAGLASWRQAQPQLESDTLMSSPLRTGSLSKLSMKEPKVGVDDVTSVGVSLAVPQCTVERTASDGIEDVVVDASPGSGSGV